MWALYQGFEIVKLCVWATSAVDVTVTCPPFSICVSSACVREMLWVCASVRVLVYVTPPRRRTGKVIGMNVHIVCMFERNRGCYTEPGSWFDGRVSVVFSASQGIESCRKHDQGLSRSNHEFPAVHFRFLLFGWLFVCRNTITGFLQELVSCRVIGYIDSSELMGEPYTSSVENIEK